MSIIVLLFRFIVGLALGSFLNVVAFRYKDGGRLFDWKKIGGRSQCRGCRKKLRWYELAPLVSFVIQGGGCRRCGKPLSWQYPIVELLSGLALLLPLFWALVALAMILLSAIDWRLLVIPDGLNIFLAALGLLAVFLVPANPLVNRFLAGIVGAGALGLIVLASRGRAMGMGDVKLAGALGLLAGWPDIVLGLGLAFIVGGIWGAALLITGNGKMKTLVPFGPFLVIGFWLTYFFGQPLLAWYFSLI